MRKFLFFICLASFGSLGMQCTEEEVAMACANAGDMCPDVFTQQEVCQAMDSIWFNNSENVEDFEALADLCPGFFLVGGPLIPVEPCPVFPTPSPAAVESLTVELQE